MLDKEEIAVEVRRLLGVRQREAEKLDRLHSYWRGRQDYPILPRSVPSEVTHLAEMSRVNMIALVVDVLAQGLFVDGFREPRAAENNAEVWDIWQANGMDSRQIGVHRATAAYGAAYTIVVPGTPHAIIRGVSPRRLTTLYGYDDLWPTTALDVDHSSNGQTSFRLYDDEAVYFVEATVDTTGRVTGLPIELPDDHVVTGAVEHNMGVCPVIRFRNHEDLDDDSCLLGEVEPLMPLQDQIDATTFGLMVAQHFQAFKQRWIVGWVGEAEAAQATAASRLWSFEDPDVKVGEFGQADLGGYLDSRQASYESLAMMSQTPPHYLLGRLVNLSADALAAAESGHQRKLDERQTTWGESWEQTLRLAADTEGIAVTDDAEVRWRDTEARSLSQVVDALGKMTQMLNIPPEELWERVPGVSQQDVERWKEANARNDPLASLTRLLDEQQRLPGGRPAFPAA